MHASQKLKLAILVATAMLWWPQHAWVTAAWLSCMICCSLVAINADLQSLLSFFLKLLPINQAGKWTTPKPMQQRATAGNPASG